VLSQIISETNDPLTKILAKYQSYRVEKNLSVYKYKEVIHDYINKYNNSYINEYLSFKLDFFHKQSYCYNGFFLSMENNSSIIDRYETLIAIFSLFFSSGFDITDIEFLSEYINDIKIHIDDQRLNNILYLLGKYDSINMTKENSDFIGVLDLYSQGQYEKVLKETPKLLLIYPDNIDLYKVYIKTIIYLGLTFEDVFESSSFAGKILKNFFDVISKNEHTQTAYNNLYKIIISTGLTNWSYKIFTFLLNEKFFEDIEINALAFESIYSEYINPQLIFCLDNKSYSLFTQNLLNSIDSSTVKFLCNIKSLISDEKLQYNDIVIDKFRTKIYRAEALLNKGDDELAFEIYDDISENNEYESLLSFNIERIVTNKVSYYLKDIDISKTINAVSLITNINIFNENYSTSLYNKKLISITENSDNDELIADISTPIFLYQHNILGNKLWIAYDNFLATHDIIYPHEIGNISSRFPKDKLIFFLKHICTKDVYDSSPFYNNQDDLDNQRIEVCLLLTKIDEINASDYINEISEINREILIRKGIKQFDQSKIYVDVKGIKSNIEKELKENFDRYLELATIPIDQLKEIDSEVGDLVVFFLENNIDTSINAINNPQDLKITSYNRFAQFAEMFYTIREKFISSNDYGLDTYLSLRIRHGTLLGMIRSVFENRHLITKKDGELKVYTKNHHWLNKFYFLNSEESDKFNEIMSSFSQTIDGLSDELKNKWLQIKTELKNSEGLFDYSYLKDSALLSLFQSSFGKISNYNDFFDSVISELWKRTEVNLDNVRNYISEIMKNKMTESLTNLQLELEGLINKDKHTEINELISEITRCHTSISIELFNISEWFKRTNNKTINDFDIKLPLQACLATLRKIEPEFSYIDPKLSIMYITIEKYTIFQLKSIPVLIVCEDKKSYLNAG